MQHSQVVVPAHTGLSQDAVLLWLLRILTADVADLSLGVVRDEARLVHGTDRHACGREGKEE